jgi:hypothetical protein
MMNFIKNAAVYCLFLLLIGLFILICTFLFGCSAKPDNEISMMADRCMSHGKSIKIEFTPHPMSKETLESEEKK